MNMKIDSKLGPSLNNAGQKFIALGRKIGQLEVHPELIGKQIPIKLHQLLETIDHRILTFSPKICFHSAAALKLTGDKELLSSLANKPLSALELLQQNGYSIRKATVELKAAKIPDILWVALPNVKTTNNILFIHEGTLKRAQKVGFSEKGATIPSLPPPVSIEIILSEALLPVKKQAGEEQSHKELFLAILIEIVRKINRISTERTRIEMLSYIAGEISKSNPVLGGQMFGEILALINKLTGGVDEENTSGYSRIHNKIKMYIPATDIVISSANYLPELIEMLYRKWSKGEADTEHLIPSGLPLSTISYTFYKMGNLPPSQLKELIPIVMIQLLQMLKKKPGDLLSQSSERDEIAVNLGLLASSIVGAHPDIAYDLYILFSLLLCDSWSDRISNNIKEILEGIIKLDHEKATFILELILHYTIREKDSFYYQKTMLRELASIILKKLQEPEI